VYISNAVLKTHDDLSAILHLSIMVENTAQLSLVLGRISQLPSIQEVRRKT